MRTGNLTPLRAVRQHCLSCAGRPKDVRLCPAKDCSLFVFRMGTNPARAGIGPGWVAKVNPTSKIVDSVKDSAKDSAMNDAYEGSAKDKTGSSSLGAPSKKSVWSGISVNKTGQIEVRETEEGLLIKIISNQT